MTRREVHRAVDRLVDLITRQGISEAETAEVEALIDLLRRQRAKVEGLPRCPHCVTEARAQALAQSEDYNWDTLPESTRATFVREIVEKDWLEAGLTRGLSESPFPPDGNDNDL